MLKYPSAIVRSGPSNSVEDKRPGNSDEDSFDESDYITVDPSPSPAARTRTISSIASIPRTKMKKTTPHIWDKNFQTPQKEKGKKMQKSEFPSIERKRKVTMKSQSPTFPKIVRTFSARSYYQEAEMADTRPPVKKKEKKTEKRLLMDHRERVRRLFGNLDFLVGGGVG